MRVGVVVPNQVPIASPDAIVGVARAAEESGFDSVWVADHIAIPMQFESRYPLEPAKRFDPIEQEVYYEPLVTLAHVAAVTTSVRLGTSALIPTLRHPVYTAKLVATVDQLSGGRVVLAVGAGWLAEEFTILGVEGFDARGAMLAEHCTVLRRLWSEDEVAWAGRFYDFPALRSAPKPVQAGGPPLWMGGSTRAARRRAVAVADGWQPIGLGPEELAAARSELEAELTEAGREPAAFDICGRCDVAIGTAPDDRAPNGVYGGAGEVVDGLAAYADAGCNELILDVLPHDAIDDKAAAIRRIGAEVLPHLG